MNALIFAVFTILTIFVATVAHYKKKLRNIEKKVFRIEFIGAATNCPGCGQRLYGEENFCQSCGASMEWIIKK